MSLAPFKGEDSDTFVVEKNKMAEPLKNMYNDYFIKRLSADIKNASPSFDDSAFIALVLNKDWEKKELKERMRHITESMNAAFSEDYIQTLSALKSIAPNYQEFTAIIFPDYVEVYGLDYFEESIDALQLFTECCSSELAVRPFIIKYGDKMMAQMNKWATSSNHHHRRLASEGCRPRLPWAMALPAFKKDPTAVLQIIEQLKDDDSEYVRRSVANNLNDISKDHPDLAFEVATRWFGHSKERDALVKHSLRTLLKAGHKGAMTLFGFTDADHIQVLDFSSRGTVSLGDDYNFTFRLKSDDKHLGLIRLEYAIYFLRKNGTHGKKVFKISETENKLNEKEITRKHSFRPITTRVYYPGEHFVSIIVNGKELNKEAFEVKA